MCRDFLKLVVPADLEFGTGFLINSDNEKSTQCDIVIYDPHAMPLVQNEQKQRFFLVEAVASIGEVKSTLSKYELKKTLIKLQQVKEKRKTFKHWDKDHNFRTPKQRDRYSYVGGGPACDYRELMFTFIICKKITNPITEKEIDEAYDDNSHPMYRHNMILSIEDGLYIYHSEKYVEHNKTARPYEKNGEYTTKRISPGKDGITHIKYFAKYMFEGTIIPPILYPEIEDYIKIDENS